MSPTLLLDLDDTLLKNNIDDFLPHYLQLYSREVAEFIEPSNFVKSLMAGTNAMVNNRNPDCTLKEVFESVFFPLVGVDPYDFKRVEDHFYKQIFPKLQQFTEPIPEAKQLIQQAIQRGYQLAITTNPLFPAKAVFHRLAWSELSPDAFPFELITSYENFHYAKPDPAFFAEALGILGWPADPAIVIGDDLERDIHPGQILGLPAYWVTSQGRDERSSPPNSYLGVGKLADFMNWLDSAPTELLKPKFEHPEALLAILRATPAVLDDTARIFEFDIWSSKPNLDEWSFSEILCHLRDVDKEVNLPRLGRVIKQENPFIPGEDTDSWAEERQYHLQDGAQALQEFINIRLKLIEQLEALSLEDWGKSARHAIFGPTNLKELVSFITAHDKLHLQQVHALRQSLGLMSGSKFEGK